MKLFEVFWNRWEQCSTIDCVKFREERKENREKKRDRERGDEEIRDRERKGGHRERKTERGKVFEHDREKEETMKKGRVRKRKSWWYTTQWKAEGSYKRYIYKCISIYMYTYLNRRRYRGRHRHGSIPEEVWVQMNLSKCWNPPEHNWKFAKSAPDEAV